MFDVEALNPRVAGSQGDQQRTQTNEIKNALFPFDEIPNDSFWFAFEEKYVKKKKNVLKPEDIEGFFTRLTCNPGAVV